MSAHHLGDAAVRPSPPALPLRGRLWRRHVRGLALEASRKGEPLGVRTGRSVAEANSTDHPARYLGWMNSPRSFRPISRPNPSVPFSLQTSVFSLRPSIGNWQSRVPPSLFSHRGSASNTAPSRSRLGSAPRAKKRYQTKPFKSVAAQGNPSSKVRLGFGAAYVGPDQSAIGTRQSAINRVASASRSDPLRASGRGSDGCAPHDP